MPHSNADQERRTARLPRSNAPLERGQRLEWPCGKAHGDRIPDQDPPARPDHAHDSAPKPGTAALFDEHPALEAGLESIDQRARSSQSGQLDGGLGTKLEDRTERQAFEIETRRQYVFSEVPGSQLVAIGAQRFEKLRRDQMDLAQVGHLGTAPRQISMADEGARMDISFGSQSLQENEAFASRLAEAVKR